MDYLIIGLLILLIIVSIFSLSKNINESNITERLGRLESNTIKELGEFKSSIERTLNDDFEKINIKMEARLRLIDDKVNARLDENFEKTNKTFVSVLERLSKIDEAQKKIDNLSNDIVSLQGILTDKKTRGTFGEVNLRNIMVNVFGEKNDKIYELQYKYPNGTQVDCALFAPEPLGVISIDSKFPLENYQKMIDKKNSEEVRLHAGKQFKIDIKKHIDDIASKYIIPNVTTEQAIMFLPAEAVFAEINAYHTDIIEYSHKKRVWITSPTTLISTLTTLQIMFKNIERDKHASLIREELNFLSEDFKRYKIRWDKLYKSISTVSNDVKEIYTTTNKITRRFDSISQGSLDYIDPILIETEDEEDFIKSS